jgi:Tol biopolymer transport system component
VAWTGDGASVVFAGGRPDESHVWVVPLTSGGAPRRLPFGDNANALSVARRGHRLAFEQRIQDFNVWRVATGRPGTATLLLHSTRTDYTPDLSPDGARIAFASNRSGRFAVWTCDQDGRGCVEFEAAHGMSSPRWSPDGAHIAAAGMDDETANVDLFVLDVQGRFARRLTDHPAVDTLPTWSRDGRWLYFASNRTGEFELWRVPVAGGEPQRITRHGASFASQSQDGRWIYFCKGNPFGTLWRVPSYGGDETLVLDKHVQFRNWALWQDRLVYMDEQPGAERRIEMLDAIGGRTTLLASLGAQSRTGPGFAISRDGKWILYAQRDQVVGDIMMVDHFR